MYHPDSAVTPDVATAAQPLKTFDVSFVDMALASQILWWIFSARLAFFRFWFVILHPKMKG
jgi:hypothetical protein